MPQEQCQSTSTGTSEANLCTVTSEAPAQPLLEHDMVKEQIRHTLCRTVNIILLQSVGGKLFHCEENLTVENSIPCTL